MRTRRRENNIHGRRRALRKNLQAVYCQELQQRFAKEEENQRRPTKDIQHSICKFCGVTLTSGGERASFEKPFLPVGQIREECKMG